MCVYGIVLSGSITLFLDDNRRLVLNAGDVKGTEWTRSSSCFVCFQGFFLLTCKGNWSLPCSVKECTDRRLRTRTRVGVIPCVAEERYSMITTRDQYATLRQDLFRKANYRLCIASQLYIFQLVEYRFRPVIVYVVEQALLVWLVLSLPFNGSDYRPGCKFISAQS